MKNVYHSFLAIMLLIILFAFSPTKTSLSGKVTDKDTGDAIIFANLALYHQKKLIAGTQTDFDGNYQFLHIQPGTYDMKVSFPGYTTIEVTGIRVLAETNTPLNVQLKKSGTNFGQIVVEAYRVPLLTPDVCTQRHSSSKKMLPIPTQKIKKLHFNSAESPSIPIRRARTSPKRSNTQDTLPSTPDYTSPPDGTDTPKKQVPNSQIKNQAARCDCISAPKG